MPALPALRSAFSTLTNRAPQAARASPQAAAHFCCVTRQGYGSFWCMRALMKFSLVRIAFESMLQLACPAFHGCSFCHFSSFRPPSPLPSTGRACISRGGSAHSSAGWCQGAGCPQLCEGGSGGWGGHVWHRCVAGYQYFCVVRYRIVRCCVGL